MNVPKLRFKEFDGEWEADFLEKAIDVKSGKDYKHLDKGNVPVYGTGGYMLSVNDYLSDKDAIGIGRKGSIDKPQKLIAPFWTVDTLFYCLPKEHNNLSFLFTLFQKVPWKKFDESTGVPSLSKTTIEKIKINLPNKDEQKKIGDFFELINKKIQLQQQKIDLLQEQKKGFLQKMFPKAGETHPEIRFDGFIGDWEELALKEVGDFIRTSIDPQAAPDFEFIEYSMPSYDNGRLPGHVLGKSMQSMRLKISGKVLLINKLNVRQKRIWLIEDAPDNAVASNEFMPFTSEKIDMNFLEQLMLSDETTRDLESISSGTSNSQKRITPSDVLKYKIKLPKKYDEQEKIGAFFKNMDENIGLQTQKLKIYKEQKKGFMQLMFI